MNELHFSLTVDFTPAANGAAFTPYVSVEGAEERGEVVRRGMPLDVANDLWEAFNRAARLGAGLPVGCLV